MRRRPIHTPTPTNATAMVVARWHSEQTTDKIHPCGLLPATRPHPIPCADQVLSARVPSAPGLDGGTVRCRLARPQHSLSRASSSTSVPGLPDQHVPRSTPVPLLARSSYPCIWLASGATPPSLRRPSTRFARVTLRRASIAAHGAIPSYLPPNWQRAARPVREVV